MLHDSSSHALAGASGKIRYYADSGNLKRGTRASIDGTKSLANQFAKRENLSQKLS